MSALAEHHIWDLQPYQPGKALKEVRAQYGIENLVKLASNENCFGPSPKATKAIAQALSHAHLYPIEDRLSVKEKICDYHHAHSLEAKHVVLGNGSNELIVLLVRALLAPHEVLLNAWPSFLMYRLAAQIHQRQEVTVPLTADLKYDVQAIIQAAKKSPHAKLLFIANPNNPTGNYLTQAEMKELMEHLPQETVVVIDEAYADYVTKKDYPQAMEWVLKRPRTVVLRTFSKIFGLAGLRIGYAVCDPQISEILHRIRDPFNVNCLAQEAAKAALEDAEHIKLSKENNQTEYVKMQEALKAFPVKTSDSVGNFILIHLADFLPKTEVVIQKFLEQGVIVRGVANYDLPRSLRVTIGKPEENQQFLLAFSRLCKQSSPPFLSSLSGE